MYPELITLDLPVLGTITITSFGVMMALSFLTGFWIVRLELLRKGMDEELAGDVLMGAIIGGIVGAKVYYVLLNWPQTVQDPFGMLFSRSEWPWRFIAGKRRSRFSPMSAHPLSPWRTPWGEWAVFWWATTMVVRRTAGWGSRSRTAVRPVRPGTSVACSEFPFPSPFPTRPFSLFTPPSCTRSACLC